MFAQLKGVINDLGRVKHLILSMIRRSLVDPG
jgi:hypothetical protein